MVKLRLKRMGRKFDAFYRIVAADARAPRDGKFIEEVGFYNPHSKELRVDTKLWDKWISEGAVPTMTVKNLFKKLNSSNVEVIETTGDSKLVKISGKKKKGKEVAPIQAPEVEAPVTEEAPAVEAAPEAPVVEEAPAVETPAEESTQDPEE